jgi:hypothetical protein
MASHYPCRACGLPTEGIDAYVICPDCTLDFDSQFSERERGDALDRSPIAGEAEARLRRLLDDW